MSPQTLERFAPDVHDGAPEGAEEIRSPERLNGQPRPVEGAVVETSGKAKQLVESSASELFDRYAQQYRIIRVGDSVLADDGESLKRIGDVRDLTEQQQRSLEQ